jgi:hypothetical protein
VILLIFVGEVCAQCWKFYGGAGGYEFNESLSCLRNDLIPSDAIFMYTLFYIAKSNNLIDFYKGLTSIPENLFYGLTRLANLYCDFFKRMEVINCFPRDLNYNSLSSIPETAFRGIPNVTSL